jgi:hypothetical protein
MRQLEPTPLTDALKGLEGKWVALKNGEVIAANETPDALYRDLHARQIRGTTILRVPDEHEPEMVGLG